MPVEKSNRDPERTDKLHNALIFLEDTNKYRNLHSGVVVIVFLISAGVGIYSFFIAIDLLVWLGFSGVDSSAPASVAWIVLLVVWVLTFLTIMSILNATGIKDVRSVTSCYLSTLTLGLDELNELSDVVASRNWKHGSIVTSIVTELTEKQLDS